MTKSILSAIAILFLLFSCAKSVEKEQKRWKYNTERVDLLSQTYPNFKDVISECKTAAEKEYVAAIKMSNEEDKIDALSAANKTLRPSFINELSSLEDLTKEVRDLNKEVLKLAAGENQAILALAGSMEIEQKIGNCNTSIRSARPTSLKAANMILKNSLKPIKDSRDELKKIVSELKSSE